MADEYGDVFKMTEAERQDDIFHRLYGYPRPKSKRDIARHEQVRGKVPMTPTEELGYYEDAQPAPSVIKEEPAGPSWLDRAKDLYRMSGGIGGKAAMLAALLGSQGDSVNQVRARDEAREKEEAAKLMRQRMAEEKMRRISERAAMQEL